MTNYDSNEIVRSYQQAQNKTEQVFILADLTLSDTDTIIEILNDAGVLRNGDINKRICCRCGAEYVALTNKGIPTCLNCRSKRTEIVKMEYRLKRLTAEIQDKTRDIGILKNKSEKLRRQIDDLKRKLGGERA